MNIRNIIILPFLLLIICCDGQNNKNNMNNKVSIINNNKDDDLKCGNITFYNRVQNLWSNFKIKNYPFTAINSEKHLYFIDDCNNIIVSADKRVYLFREVLNDNIQNNYDYNEAPYIAIDILTQNYASYASIIDRKVTFLSLTNAKADFINSHDFLFEQHIYKISDDLLKELPILIRNNKVDIFISDLEELINNTPLTENNVQTYNDIAFYLGENKKSNEAIFLLNKITNAYPERVVAWLNIADNYWNLNNKIKAKSAYQQYILLMKSQEKKISKIPQRVYERIK